VPGPGQQGPRSAEQDLDHGETCLLPIVAMIAALCEHCGGAPPKPATVARWKQRYPELLDEQIDGFLLQARSRSSTRVASGSLTPSLGLQACPPRVWRDRAADG
jgi:hypothetical protein